MNFVGPSELDFLGLCHGTEKMMHWHWIAVTDVLVARADGMEMDTP